MAPRRPSLIVSDDLQNNSSVRPRGVGSTAGTPTVAAMHAPGWTVNSSRPFFAAVRATNFPEAMRGGCFQHARRELRRAGRAPRRPRRRCGKFRMAGKLAGDNPSLAVDHPARLFAGIRKARMIVSVDHLAG